MPDIRHLTADLLQALARGDIDTDKLAERLEGHPLTECPTCREAYQEYLQELGACHDAVLDRLPEMIRRAEAERDRALRWVAQLRKLSQDDRLERIHRAKTRYRGEGFVRVLLTESRQALPAHPIVSGEWAAAAEEVLDLSKLQSPELEAMAVAYRGNARRALGDLRGARRCFVRVFRIFARNDEQIPILTVAEILRLAASLFLLEHEFERAEEALETASFAYLSCGQTRDAVAVLIKLGILYEDRGELESAIEITSRAVARLDRTEEPELYAIARCNLGFQLHGAGRYADARRILVEDAELLARHPEPFFQARITFLEGKLFAAEGDSRSAESSFLEAREAFAGQGAALAFAVTSLDLASLYLSQGRMQQVSELASQTLRIFETQEVHVYAYAALRLFAEAAREGTVTAELLEKVSTYLGKAEEDPATVASGVN